MTIHKNVQLCAAKTALQSLGKPQAIPYNHDAGLLMRRRRGHRATGADAHTRRAPCRPTGKPSGHNSQDTIPCLHACLAAVPASKPIALFNSYDK